MHVDLDTLLLIIATPLLIVGLFGAYQQWRSDHPRHRHPAE